MNEVSEKKKNHERFGLSAAEYANLLEGVRYIGSIVLTVIITFLIVAIGSKLIGFY